MANLLVSARDTHAGVREGAVPGVESERHVRPSHKIWSLTVRGRSLHLDAPHGTFEVLGFSDDVRRVVEALPEGTDVECEGSFDGGGTIVHLYVTKVRRILKDMSGRVMELPDAIIAADGRLAATRARIHFDAGRIDDAARDVGFLLALGDDQALGELERLPIERQLELRSQVVEWQANRRATWRALRHVPFDQWSDLHLEQAVGQGLTNGGVFGAAPGIRVEALLEELERRKRPTRTLAKQTQKLRRAQATEGDTYFRVTPEIEMPRAVGADAMGVFLSGSLSAGKTVTLRGPHRTETTERRPLVVLISQDGHEVQRWLDVWADRVVEGIALQLDSKAPRGIRLSDGKLMFEFANKIEHHDGELVWGVHERDPHARTMRSEIRHIPTGFSIAQFDTWVDSVVWNAKHIFVYGASPQTLTREGRRVSADVPPPPATLEIETATGKHTVPSAHAPWLFGTWRSQDAGGWVLHQKYRQLYIAASEPGASWIGIELAQSPTQVELAPPWLAIHYTDQPIVLVALAEIMSAQEIRIDGKRFAKRSRIDPALVLALAFPPWYGALVAAGVVPPRSAVERDALLFRLFGPDATPNPSALSRVLAEGSPYFISHADYFVDADDGLYDQLNAVFAHDGVRVRELERVHSDDAVDEGDTATEYTLTLEVSGAGRTIKRRTGWSIDAVIITIDRLLDDLGIQRRLYAVTSYVSHRRTFLALSPEQRRDLVAAGIEGIRAGARSV